ncbi:MAG: CotH kinase family protein [Bacteroidales bacterium]
MPYTKYIIIFIFLFSINGIKAQTYSGVGDTIPDDGSTIDFPIVVSGLVPPTIDTTNFGLESVCIDLVHTWDADLDIRLVAPDGTEVILTSGNGNDGDNYTNTCFRSDATTSIVTGSAPFTGYYRPQGSLGIVNNGQNANGTWNLRIYDTYAWADWGILYTWNITFGNNPAQVFHFSSSNLPIVVINTSGQIIPEDPKIMAHMGIINNGTGIRNYLTDSFNNYNGYIGIELRGSSSQTFPKKSYSFETRDSLGTEINASILGMPQENDWCLIANYSDKTLLRNALTYDFSKLMGHWASRNRFCEVVLNGEYQGVYLLLEKIKRDLNRVDIAKLDSNEITGDDVTGGYIIKIDKQAGSGGDGWTSAYPPAVNSSGQTIYYQYEYPKSYNIVQQQKDYIQAYVDSFETALTSAYFTDTAIGYAKYADVNSFIDYFIINEISKNVDGYRLSTFLYKDKYSNGGKLYIGPVWDFDLAWWNANYCGGDDYTGWAYKFGDICAYDNWQVPSWWYRFMEDTIFTGKLKCRWNYLRTTILDTTNLYHYIDSVSTYIDEGQQRNFTYWPIIGIWVWPNPSPLATTYTGEINALKKWIRNRLAWLDDSIPGNCNSTASVNYIEPTGILKVYPNPSTDGNVFIQLPVMHSNSPYIEIADITGKNLINYPVHPNERKINLQLPFTSGIYFIRFSDGNKSFHQKIIISK